MKNLLFLDTETTDLVDGRLIELAYASNEDDITIILAKPSVPITHEAMAVHHITESEVINMPAFQDRQDFEEIRRLIENSILVAHNAKFDIGILSREGIIPREFIDTKQIAMHLFPEASQYKLQYLRYYLGCRVMKDATAHSAAGDVRVLIAVFNKLKQKLSEQFELNTDNEVIQKMLTLSQEPALLSKIYFGKHRGKYFREINHTDRGYMEWLFKNSHDDENVRFTVEHWMSIKSV